MFHKLVFFLRWELNADILGLKTYAMCCIPERPCGSLMKMEVSMMRHFTCEVKTGGTALTGMISASDDIFLEEKRCTQPPLPLITELEV